MSKDRHTPSTNVIGEIFLLRLTGHFSIGYTMESANSEDVSLFQFPFVKFQYGPRFTSVQENRQDK